MFNLVANKIKLEVAAQIKYKNNIKIKNHNLKIKIKQNGFRL
jgi:hypothetical protein